MSTSEIRHGAATDIGHSRDKQEDSMLTNPPLFVVADGMGGHRRGDIASQMAVSMLSEDVVEDHEALTAAIQRANRAIYDAAEADHSLDGMGTTLVALFAKDDSAQIAHVGDSRAYLLRDGEISRLTEDHSYVTSLVREGRLSEDEAEHHPQRSILERALGQESEVEIDIRVIDTEPGDRILLCTDGLTSHLTDLEIEDILSSVKNPQDASKRLVREALDAGGNDNVTVIVVDYPGGTPGRPRIPPRKKRIRLAVAAIATLLVLALIAVAARSAINNNYYVGSNRGNVAIYRGLPGSFAGIELQEVQSRTNISVNSLPDIWDERLKEGSLRADSVTEAERIVDRLRQLSEVETDPAP